MTKQVRAWSKAPIPTGFCAQIHVFILLNHKNTVRGLCSPWLSLFPTPELWQGGIWILKEIFWCKEPQLKSSDLGFLGLWENSTYSWSNVSSSEPGRGSKPFIIPWKKQFCCKILVPSLPATQNSRWVISVISHLNPSFPPPNQSQKTRAGYKCYGEIIKLQRNKPQISVCCSVSIWWSTN